MNEPEILYQKYNRKIYNLAYRMTGNTDDAYDITQDTFIQGFKSIDKFRGESEIYTWLYKIAKNKCLKLLENRNRSRFLSLQSLIDKQSSTPDEELSETEKTNYITQVKDGCLSGLLRCLSLQQRIVFILNILFDVPISQVANIIDKSENATRILVHRSKQHMKEYLCINCSLYDSKNKCQCENLINFSLKQGWIQKNSPVEIELEIKNIKNVVHIYKTLHESAPSMEFEKQMKLLFAQKEEFSILNNKKVK